MDNGAVATLAKKYFLPAGEPRPPRVTRGKPGRPLLLSLTLHKNLTEKTMAQVKDSHLDAILNTFNALEERLSDPSVTADPDRLTSLSRERARLEPTVRLIQQFRQTRNQLEDLQVGIASERDPELLSALRDEKQSLEHTYSSLDEELQIAMLPRDASAGKNVIVEIRGGTGGDEAALFARDLFRMYTRFLEKRGIEFEVLDISETGLNGIKEAVFIVRGPDAYDLLHQEAGVHRVQRVPETEASGRIHTSACTVAVMPEADESELNLRNEDIRVDVFRASGAGGQHVNRTESAVRLTHIPTGIVVSMQDEKSQHKNRAKAMQILAARFAEKQRAEEHAVMAAEKKAQVGSGDRSDKIRTYNYPQNRVTDHRINYTAHNLDQIMEGALDDLISALLQEKRQKLLAELNGA